MRDSTARFLSKLHTGSYRLTRGAIGRRLVGNDMLLLTTVGRRSGESHTVPLLYLRDGRRVVVIASWGGRDIHPEWFLNLEADPSVSVRIDGSDFDGTAVLAGEPDRTIWFERAVEAYDGYADYQLKTDRQIPVVFVDLAERPIGGRKF